MRSLTIFFAMAIAAVAGAQEPSLGVVGGSWVAQGPAPALFGQTEGLANNPVAGAVNAIVPHPTDANILWIAAVNGGIWKTTNALAASPTWVPETDTLRSTSFGALALDPTDATFNTLVGAYARTSSMASNGGARGGIVRTTNGGSSWVDLGQSTLDGRNVRAVIARGATIVVAVDNSDNFFCTELGIYRSTNTGSTFAIVSGAVGSGIPLGRAFDVVGDPTNNAILYTVIKDGPPCGGVNGVYKSTNTGATWTKVSSGTMDVLMADDTTFRSARLAVGASGQIYVAIVNDGQLSGLFRSATGGSSWTQLDTPMTNEGGTLVGIHPDEEEEPGGQGSLHLSIAADPTDANIVYVAGDRQPAPFPNSLGAFNYSGRIFRVNAAAGAGTQATSLTHCSAATAACNNTISTNSNSAPHADSRRMVFDAAGNLLESDDGGIYRRTNPRTTGDWFPVVGNLRVTEMHSVAYDRVSNMIFGGCQDTGTSEQTVADGWTWTQVSQGDGGVVAVDDSSSATTSRRFTSYQYLGGLLRRIVNTSGVTTSQVFPALTVISGVGFSAQFYTPIVTNAVNPARMLIAGYSDLYESLDRADTISGLGLFIPATAMVYGGRSGGVDNADVIYAIAGGTVYLRTTGAGALVATNPVPGGAFLRDIAVDPNDYTKVYVINAIGQVYSSTNSGGNWTNITGNLGSGTTVLQSLVFVTGNPNALAAGGVNGVFRMATNNAGVWSQFGSGMSNAVVWDMDHDPVDDTLVASALGRATWKLSPAGNLGPLPTMSINDVTVAEGNAGVTNAVFTVTLTPASAQTITVNYATADGTAQVGSQSVSNTSAIAIPSSGNATPYPSSIAIAGGGTITKVTVTLTGFSHTYTGDVDMLLVGPGGQSVLLMSDVASNSASSNLTLTFDDAASSPTSAPLISGSYKPADLSDCCGGTDAFGAPAPAAPYGSALSVFNGTSPAGTWSLYVLDDFTGDSGSISGGWTLNLSTSAGDYVATSGLLTLLPGATTGTITVPVNGDAATEPNETFFVNLSVAVGASLVDAQGQGTITNDDGGLAAPTNVVANATTATNVNLTWTVAAGAASYRVYRSSGGGTYTLVGSPATNSFSDPTALANTAYLYKVRSFAGSESGDSNVDLATTVIFTDPALAVGGTKVRVVHFSELLTAVNAVRTLAASGAIAFTAPVPATSVTIRRQHVIDLRTGLDAARVILGLPALTYTDPVITVGSTKVKAAHLNELRGGVQ